VEVSENHVFSEGALGEISEPDRIKIKKNTIFLLAFACTELQKEFQTLNFIKIPGLDSRKNFHDGHG